MTDEMRYNEILKALGELIAEKNTSISLADYEIQTLRLRLEEAEAQIEELKKGTE